MPSNASQIGSYLRPGRRVHLVGIGGVSMRPLGLVLRGMGVDISGSDMSVSSSTDDLIAKGIPVYIGHRAENIAGAEALIRTAAVHNDNPEIAAARALGIPIFERAQAWGHIMKAYERAICVAGTHGKTTTTSMVTHIFMAAQADPTVMIGGYLPLLQAGHRVGGGHTIIMESCEYCNSFLNFFPTIAVILNVEADHLDFFKDLKDVQKSFRAFAQLVPQGGQVIANGDDPNTNEALDGIDRLTFGFGEHCDVRAVNWSEDYHSFDVLCGGKPYGHFDLQVIGRHNLLNALAAAAVAWHCGIPAELAAEALSQFHGAGRRLEFKGTYNGANVYDDYAHHPGELEALLTSVQSMPHKRIICAFQPHTYTRTSALFDDFVKELRRVDIAVLAEIYAAREQNTLGISSADMAAQIPGSVYCETLPEVTAYLREIAQPGDLILTVGAGDIYKAGEALLKNN
jgi:UDP-N-acetylmuramate--alanine ligase